MPESESRGEASGWVDAKVRAPGSFKGGDLEVPARRKDADGLGSHIGLGKGDAGGETEETEGRGERRLHDVDEEYDVGY